MITSVWLTSVIAHSYRMFFSCDENFKISLRNFQICNTVVLTPVHRLCITPPWSTCSITGRSTFAPSPICPLLISDIHQSNLWTCVCLGVCVTGFFFRLYMWDHIVLIFFCLTSSWLISLNITSSRPIHVAAVPAFHSFSWLNAIPLCIYTYQAFFITHPLMDTKLFPYLSYYK